MRLNYTAVMNALTNSDFDDLIDTLAAYDTIKVWSWLTTIFGDLAQKPGDELSGSVLTRLSERISIRPEAMRVALHRLRKDGWIVVRKEGRGSFYRLSNSALAETVAASQRIYATEIESPTCWHVVLTDPKGDCALEERGEYARINDTCFLGAGSRTKSVDGLALEFAAAEMPAWLVAAVATDDVDAPFRSLAQVLATVASTIAQGDDASSLDRLALRLLVLHHWRRAVLRTPAIIEQLRGTDWIGAECRRQSVLIFDALPRSQI